jgi:hypothetical protein
MSYLLNLVMAGVLVLFLHDLSDALLILARFYSEYKDKRRPLLIATYLVAWASWVYFRLLAFPLCCIWEVLLAEDNIVAFTDPLLL